MAIYDPRCTNIVRATVEENKVPTKIVTATYLYIKDLTAEQVDTYKKILGGCTVKSSDGTKTYKIRFSSYKCDAILPKVEKEPKPKEERKPADPKNKAAKCKRAKKHARKYTTRQQMKMTAKKASRKDRYAGKFTANPDKDAKKKEMLENIPVAGRNRKKVMFRRGKSMFKNAYKVTPGTHEDNLAKKMRQRAKKAGQYLVKQETKKAVKQPVMQVKKGSKKPVQKEMALAA